MLCAYFVEVVRISYRLGWTRGWFRLSAGLARLLPEARSCPVPVPELGELIVDFGESMCFPVIARGFVPGAETTLLKRILRQGDVVYDIGASYGAVSAHASKWIGETGQVVALEPSEAAFRLLLSNTARRSNIRPYNVALGDRRAQATFFTAEKVDMSSFSAIEVGLPVRTVHSVQVWPLDQLFLEEALPVPDLIKCDVEGAELKVFMGGKRVLSHGPMVFFEYIDALARPYSYKLEDLIGLLLDTLPGGTEVYRASGDGSIHRAFDHREGISNNYLAVPPKHAERLSIE